MNASRRSKPTPPVARRSATAGPTLWSTRSLGLILVAGLALVVAYYLANHLAQRKVAAKALPPAVQMDMVRGGMPVHSVSTQDAAARASGGSPAQVTGTPQDPDANRGVSETPVTAPLVADVTDPASGAEAGGRQDPGSVRAAGLQGTAPSGGGAAIYRCRQGQSVVFSQWPCDQASPGR